MGRYVNDPTNERLRPSDLTVEERPAAREDVVSIATPRFLPRSTSFLYHDTPARTYFYHLLTLLHFAAAFLSVSHIL